LPLISITSDFGSDSHYVAALKAHILQVLPSASILDISHNITSHNILQAAFVVRNSYKNFPEGSVHLIAVDSNIHKYKKYLVLEHAGQYFITSDNGIADLLFDVDPSSVWQFADELIVKEDLFPEKNIWSKVAAVLITKQKFETFLRPYAGHRKMQSLKAVVSDDKIITSVIFIDSYQNAFLNISKSEFEREQNGRKFKLYYAPRHPITKISNTYTDVPEGDELILFNENGYLEIAMNKGKAASLLGLKLGNQVIVEFEKASIE
jgi:S-adenosylmethionine hydrolase